MITEQEKIVLDKTSELWNEFLKLENGHPDDQHSVRFFIHGIQQTIGTRIASRVCPDVFTQFKKEEE